MKEKDTEDVVKKWLQGAHRWWEECEGRKNLLEYTLVCQISKIEVCMEV
ncbi:hypothetical protein LSH36_324g03047 [Paralvinella palmiformis]|uniref:Uncharacterized protein n=1 Tax=Paralvinella palmiformis TaxID=53620 RepID=A0AAD9JGM3_9ANNE|nr:hypothetical protein LSH36_324g03047 [Paralvinella palmiformis]